MTIGSMGAPKAKISITISEVLLARIDDEVERRPGASRSSVIATWLGRAADSSSATALREETIRYYDSRLAEEQHEDDAVAKTASKRAGRVRYD